MAKTEEVVDFEDAIERIVFKEGELKELKIDIRNFSKGTITPKQLKQNLLNCRSRIVEEVSNFLNYIVYKARSNAQAPSDNNLTNLNQSGLETDQLRQRIIERDELLEIVAKRIGVLVSKAKNEPNSGGESSGMGLEEAIKIEIKRVFSKIKAKEWLDMCGYDNNMFFVKLYPKLEDLYKQRFGKSEKSSNSSKDGKMIMANKMRRLGFPEEVETFVGQYISNRNIFQHSMRDISPSNLEQAREAFVKVFVYLIVSNLDSKLVSSNRETFYSFLKDYISKRLARNPIFRERMLERLKTVFYA
jgi:hypothetical protein